MFPYGNVVSICPAGIIEIICSPRNFLVLRASNLMGLPKGPGSVRPGPDGHEEMAPTGGMAVNTALQSRIRDDLEPAPSPAGREELGQYQRYVFNLAYHLCNDIDEADDLTQETFLKACEHLPDFRGEAGLRTWLGRIAINAFLARKRKKVRHESISLETIPDWAGNPERVVVRRELQWCIRHTLQHHLREDHRLVLILRDLHHLSYDEIAGVLGISSSAVKSRLHRARMAFRNHLVKSGCAGLVGDYACFCEGVRKL